jgi:hypothetical protein
MSETDRAYEVIRWARQLLEIEARRNHETAPGTAKGLRQAAEDLWRRRAEVVPCAFLGEWLHVRVEAKARMFGPYSAAERSLLEPLLDLLIERESAGCECRWTRVAPETSAARPTTLPSRRRLVS